MHTIPALSYPIGMTSLPFNSLWGEDLSHPCPLMGEFPVGNWGTGPVDILTRHVLPRAWAGPSGPRVEWAEEQALVRVATVDAEGRVNVLLHQLNHADHRGIGEFSFLLFFFLLCLHLLSNREWNHVCQG
jgi:hypothetical protein